MSKEKSGFPAPNTEETATTSLIRNGSTDTSINQGQGNENYTLTDKEVGKSADVRPETRAVGAASRSVKRRNALCSIR